MLGKKKKKLFGNNIQADCGYCSHNTGAGEKHACAFGHSPDGVCPNFSYDPLMRVPRALPPLREYDEKDFKI